MSPLGVGLSGVSYYSPEQPFLNIFKTAGGWFTQIVGGRFDTGERERLALDPNGWPKSVTAGSDGRPVGFNAVGVLLNRLQPPYYPGGKYVVLYDGEGTITYYFDAKKDARQSRPGRDVLNVKPSSSGILIQITATDPRHTGNYIRNIRVVRAEYESLLKSGEIFNPDFVQRIAPFRSLRFMDWMATNNSQQSTWDRRPKPSNALYSGPDGVPAEVMVALSNETGADAWFNIPHMASDDYIMNFAALAHRLLRRGQRVYVEYSNETWNGLFKQAHYVTAQGRAMWPTAKSDFVANRSFYGMRTAQMCEIWKRVWGTDAGRVTCVIATQTVNLGVATLSLECALWAQAPCAKNHEIEALAITGYFSTQTPEAWTSQSGGGLDAIFHELLKADNIQKYVDTIKANKKIADRYGLELDAYEGGPGYVDRKNNPALQNLYIAANRDPRMGTALYTYLTSWKEAGGKLFNQFVDIGPYTKWGSWGALESVMQTGSPKYDALMKFIADTPCWWKGCAAPRPNGNAIR